MKGWKVYIGAGVTFNSAGDRISDVQREIALQGIRAIAAQLFGGYTLTRVQGGWIGGSGRLITEDGIGLTCYSSEDFSKELQKKAKTLAQAVKNGLSQEAVVLAIEPVEMLVIE